MTFISISLNFLIDSIFLKSSFNWFHSFKQKGKKNACQVEICMLNVFVILLELDLIYLFFHNQEANKIVNMTMPGLLQSHLLLIRNSRPNSLYKRSREAFYCSSNNKCCRVLNFFQFLPEGVITRSIINLSVR